MKYYRHGDHFIKVFEFTLEGVVGSMRTMCGYNVMIEEIQEIEPDEYIQFLLEKINELSKKPETFRLYRIKDNSGLSVDYELIGVLDREIKPFSIMEGEGHSFPTRNTFKTVKHGEKPVTFNY